MATISASRLLEIDPGLAAQVASKLNQELISTAGQQLDLERSTYVDLLRAPPQPSLDLAQFRIRLTQVLESYEASLQAQKAEHVRAALEQRSTRQPSRRPRKEPTAASMRPAVADRLLDPAAFLSACQAGRLVRVRAYMQAGGHVNKSLVQAPGGETTLGLHAAVRGGHLEVAAKLLSGGANLTLRSGKDRVSALHVAVSASAETIDPRLVQLLLQAGADAHSRDAGRHRTPLLALAAECEATAKVRVANRNSANDTENVQSVRDEGSDAYLLKKRARIAELLLAEGGAEVGASDRAGRTPLCYARAAGPHGTLLLHVLCARYAMQATETSSPTSPSIASTNQSTSSTGAAAGDALMAGRNVLKEEGPNACYRGPACTYCGELFR